MKRLILLALIGFVYPNFSYANTKNSCGSNIKTGVVFCYSLEKDNSKKDNNIKVEYKELDVSPNWKFVNQYKEIILTYVERKNNKTVYTENNKEPIIMDTDEDVYNFLIGHKNNQLSERAIDKNKQKYKWYFVYSPELQSIISQFEAEEKNSVKKYDRLIKNSELYTIGLPPMITETQNKLSSYKQKKEDILKPFIPAGKTEEELEKENKEVGNCSDMIMISNNTKCLYTHVTNEVLKTKLSEYDKRIKKYNQKLELLNEKLEEEIKNLKYYQETKNDEIVKTEMKEED